MVMRIGTRLLKYHRGEGYAGPRLCHYCPGCDCLHDLAVEEERSDGQRWQWDGNRKAPTFSPAVHRQEGPAHFADSVKICSYMIVDGLIIFAPECTHKLRDCTEQLPEIPGRFLRGTREDPHDRYA